MTITNEKSYDSEHNGELASLILSYIMIPIILVKFMVIYKVIKIVHINAKKRIEIQDEIEIANNKARPLGTNDDQLEGGDELNPIYE